MVKKLNNIEEDSSSGESGHSGAGGVEFHLDLLAGQPRDDLLSPNELKRILKVHNEIHYDLVKKQKNERKERLDVKEGKRPAVANNAFGNGGFGMNNGLKTHPITAKAYFSGIDKKVIGIASENIAETNQDKKNELEQRLELKNRLQHTHTPKFNPTPRPT